MATVDDHGSAWANVILLALPDAAPRSARAARDGGRYGGSPIREAGPGMRDMDLSRLDALFSKDAISVRSPVETKQVTVPALVELIDSNTIDGGSLDEVMRALTRNEQLLPALADLESVNELTGLVQRRRRREGLRDLKRAVAMETTTIATMTELLWQQWWVFGSHLVPWIRREIIPDLGANVIPLMRFDGAIHLVVVEQPRIPDLVDRGSGHYALSPRVSAAFDLARNLVRRLEKPRPAGGDRPEPNDGRALVTVVIGHPEFVRDLDANTVQDEIRVLNTFVAGINVMTYEELIKIAEQTLGDPPDPG